MRKANIIRSIFWGLLALILLSLGITGLIYNNKIFNENKNELKRIIEIFNNNNTIKDYSERKTYITATLDGKNINIKYSGVENKEYIYKSKSGYLETTINDTDTIGKIILMVITDSIAVNKGNIEGDSYKIFNDNSIYNYKLKDGIEFSQKMNNNSLVKINLKKSIIKNENSTQENDSLQN